jgi:peptide deformylase
LFFLLQEEDLMAIRDILQLGNPLLRTSAIPVENPTSPQITALIEDLRETLAHWRATTTYGRGIAATQLGVPQRVVFLNVNQPWPLINPTIVEHSEETMVVWDACLSFLCIFFQVRRYQWIRVRYQDQTGDWQEILAESELAELLQHEIDHLDGVLALDRIINLKTMCTREEFEQRYRVESPYAQ